ncbi:Tn3 family transposase [Streptomyces scopuliridis]
MAEPLGHDTTSSRPRHRAGDEGRHCGQGRAATCAPELQEKAVKFLDLMANSIFSTTVDMTDTLRQMAAQGREVNPDDIAASSPHRRHKGLRLATTTPPPSTSRQDLYDSALRLPAGGLNRGRPRLAANRNTAGTGNCCKSGRLCSAGSAGVRRA